MANISVANHPVFLAYNPNNGTVYVTTNTGLSEISSSRNELIANVSIPATNPSFSLPCVDAASGTIYVPDQNNDVVDTISAASGAETGTIPVGPVPIQAVCDPTDGTVYLSVRGNAGITGNQVSVLPEDATKIAQNISVGKSPSGLVLDSAATDLYVVNNYFAVDNVTVVSTVTNGSVGSIDATNLSTPPDLALGGITYATTNAELYATAPSAGCSGTTLVAMSALTWSFVKSIPVGPCPYWPAYDPATQDVYVPNNDGSNVTIVSTSSNTVTGQIPVPSTTAANGGPTQVLYDPVNGLLYVAIPSTGTVSVVEPSAVPSPAVAWTNVTAVGSPRPSPRTGAMITYDAADGYTLLFGGFPSCLSGCHTAPLNDTWKFSNGVWTNITPMRSPPARVGGDLVYDPIDGYAVLFGGESCPSSCSLFNDTWEFKAGVWTQLTPTSAPSPRTGASMAFDAADGYVLLFGGFNFGSRLSDTWKFVGGQWTLLSPATSPPARNAAFLGYDVADGYVVLFGGSNGAVLGDTWIYRGGDWSQLHPAVSPSPRQGSASLLYDPALGGMVLFGGTTASTLSNQTWEFDAGQWILLASVSVPSARDGCATAGSDPAGDIVLFAGAPSVTAAPLDDSWELLSVGAPLARLYTVTFSESGLPVGTSWSVVLNGATQSSTGTSIAFSATNGTWPFQIGAPSGYLASSASGTVRVVGGPATRSVPFTSIPAGSYPVRFDEQNLPPGTAWWVNVTGQPSAESTGTVLAIDLPSGTYSYTTSSANLSWQPLNQSGSVSVASAPPSTIGVPFAFAYEIVVLARSLPGGSPWSVTVAGEIATPRLLAASFVFASTNSELDLSLPNGTFTLHVATSLAGWAATNATQNETVQGGASTERLSIVFQSSTGAPPPTILGLAYVTFVEVAAAVGVAAVAGGLFVQFWRGPAPPPKPPGPREGGGPGAPPAQGAGPDTGNSRPPPPAAPR